jgi:general secretion pathway protein D
MAEGPVDGHVTLISRQPVTADQAVVMLNAALKANGFTVIRDGQLLRITTREKAKKGNLPVHFGNKVDDIADTDELITQVIPLTSVSATKLRDDLKPMMSPDVDITANDQSNSIIVTDTSAAVRRIVEIISRLDDHEATVSELRIVPLKHADATDTAKLIDTLFKSQPSTPAMDPRTRMMMQQQGQPLPPETPENKSDRVVTAADVRTNTLLVVASTQTLAMIDHLLQTIDTDNPNPAPPAEITAFPLRFADAEEAARIVTNIFKPAKTGPSFPLIFGFGDEDQSDKKTEVPVNAIADDRTNTVIVTAPHTKLAAITKLMNQLDDHPMASSGSLRVIHLKYADADSVADLIDDMFKQKPGDTTPRNPFFDYIGIGSDDTKPQQRNPKVTVTSDSRTNTLIFSAPTDLLNVIEQMVQQLDADPTAEDTLFIYHLRNSQAANLETVLNVLFGNVNNPQGNQQGQQNQPGQSNQQQQQNQLGGLSSGNCLPSIAGGM